MRAASWRGAGPTGGGAAAVRGADSPLLAAPQAPAVGPAPAPALRETAILWSLPHPESWTMETDFPSFLPSSRVCVAVWGTESGPNDRGLWGGMEPCVCQRPAPSRLDFNGYLGLPLSEASTFVCVLILLSRSQFALKLLNPSFVPITNSLTHELQEKPSKWTFNRTAFLHQR